MKDIIDMVKDLNDKPYSPPISIISSLSPPSKKHLGRIVNDAPIVKKGLPPLPSKMKESAYLATVGVPNEWRESVFDLVVAGPMDPNNITVRRFVLSSKLDWRALHYVLLLVRTRKTTDCYNTQGAVSKVDGRLRPEEECKWIIEREYEALLKVIAKATKEPFQEILNLDQSLRHKRSKRNPLLSVTTPEARSFCFIGFINDNALKEWLWVDISYSNDDPQKHFFDPVPSYAGPQCHSEGCTVYSGLMKCSRCKEVYYCSVLHQKKDWPLHKPHCNPAK